MILEYPKEPQVIDISDNFDFDCEDYFQYLMNNKVMPNPRERYRLHQPAIGLKGASNILFKSNLLELKSMGLLTFVKRKETLYIVRDNLWMALRRYLKSEKESDSRIKLRHSIAA